MVVVRLLAKALLELIGVGTLGRRFLGCVVEEPRSTSSACRLILRTKTPIRIVDSDLDWTMVASSMSLPPWRCCSWRFGPRFARWSVGHGLTLVGSSYVGLHHANGRPEVVWWRQL